jgi:nucleolar protein 14
MQRNLKHGLSQGPSNPGSKTWPGLPELTLLHVISALWPTSDLHHVVISPARILMGSYLDLCRVRSFADLASGLFLCTLYLQYESLSKRFVPEAINFVITAILHLVPKGYESASALPGSFPAPDFHSELHQRLRISAKSSKGLIPAKADLPALLGTLEPGEQDKTDLLALAIDVLGCYADMYKGMEGFIELYDPILKIIEP